MTYAYRVITPDEWTAVQSTGHYTGSALDVNDGYIHLSPASQVEGTLRKYFACYSQVVLLQVYLPALGSAIKWEDVPSRGASFPHLYGGPLPRTAMSATWTVSARPGRPGEFELPALQN
jgi:uncharacterized protein (DUF952 family)